MGFGPNSGILLHGRASLGESVKSTIINGTPRGVSHCGRKSSMRKASMPELYRSVNMTIN